MYGWPQQNRHVKNARQLIPLFAFFVVAIVGYVLLHETKVFKKGDVVVTASGMYPGVVGTTDTIKVRVLE